MLKFEGTVSDGKMLAKRMEELTGNHSYYTRAPWYAYVVGRYYIDQNGNLLVEAEDAEPEVLNTVLQEGLVRKDKEQVCTGKQKPETTVIPFFSDQKTVPYEKTEEKQEKRKVAAYIRVSTESSDQENSYETQEKYFARLISENEDWISAGIYSDYGLSGTSGKNRTGFQRILRHCEQGRIDHVVCKSISRFARNTSDFPQLFIFYRKIMYRSHLKKKGWTRLIRQISLY